jgi:hypothetical protein
MKQVSLERSHQDSTHTIAIILTPHFSLAVPARRYSMVLRSCFLRIRTGKECLLTYSRSCLNINNGISKESRYGSTA